MAVIDHWPALTCSAETFEPETTKLNQVIGILNKIRNNCLKTLFSSYLLYVSQWGHANVTSLDKIEKLQNRTTRKILLKKEQDSVSHFYKGHGFIQVITDHSLPEVKTQS